MDFVMDAVQEDIGRNKGFYEKYEVGIAFVSCIIGGIAYGLSISVGSLVFGFFGLFLLLLSVYPAYRWLTASDSLSEQE